MALADHGRRHRPAIHQLRAVPFIAAAIRRLAVAISASSDRHAPAGQGNARGDQEGALRPGPRKRYADGEPVSSIGGGPGPVGAAHLRNHQADTPDRDRQMILFRQSETTGFPDGKKPLDEHPHPVQLGCDPGPIPIACEAAASTRSELWGRSRPAVLNDWTIGRERQRRRRPSIGALAEISEKIRA
ncbi:hypothetical protein FQR65_LT21010 [Abscondita terminalis]|nr:hypothetical protein FQR65_LT21010 [Abscondita terminalis]